MTGAWPRRCACTRTSTHMQPTWRARCRCVGHLWAPALSFALPGVDASTHISHALSQCLGMERAIVPLCHCAIVPLCHCAIVEHTCLWRWG